MKYEFCAKIGGVLCEYYLTQGQLAASVFAVFFFFLCWSAGSSEGRAWAVVRKWLGGEKCWVVAQVPTGECEKECERENADGGSSANGREGKQRACVVRVS